MNATVPPLQTRQFAVSIWPHGAVPRARGTAKDEVRVISAIGEAMQAAQENAMNPENQNAK